jgi:hypothetical protein
VCTALWGSDVGGCFLCSPEDFLTKSVNYTYIFIKSFLKIGFLWKTPVTKKVAEIFCEAVLICTIKFVAKRPGLISVF